MIQITTVVKFKTSILKFRGNPNVINRTILNLPCVLESFFLINLGNHYSANFYAMKTTGSLQGKPALSMEKGCKNHKETLCMLWINPVIFTDCGETP